MWFIQNSDSSSSQRSESKLLGHFSVSDHLDNGPVRSTHTAVPPSYDRVQQKEGTIRVRCLISGSMVLVPAVMSRRATATAHYTKTRIYGLFKNDLLKKKKDSGSANLHKEHYAVTHIK